jgi:hypothetical protein
MLLNEFLKEHRKVHQQDATVADLKPTSGGAAKADQSTHSWLAESDRPA